MGCNIRRHNVKQGETKCTMSKECAREKRSLVECLSKAPLYTSYFLNLLSLTDLELDPILPSFLGTYWEFMENKYYLKAFIQT